MELKKGLSKKWDFGKMGIKKGLWGVLYRFQPQNYCTVATVL